MIKKYKINGMDCANCATMLEIDLEEVGLKCRCSYQKEFVEVEEPFNKDKLIEVITKSGYSIQS